MGNIRVFDVCRHGSHVLGPGRRYVLWTQGCLRCCQGCITPESRPLDGGVDIDIGALAYDIVSLPNIDGVTISGGEPFLQAKGVGRLLELVHRERPEMTVIAYTGFRQEELDVVPDANALLQHVDVLIDGEYVESLNDGVGIRGSSNQRIIPLTHRLDAYLDTMNSGVRHIERVAIDSKSITTIGIPIKHKNL